MVERLDAPQPTFFLPSLEQIPDNDDDKPKAGIQIVSEVSGVFSSGLTCHPRQHPLANFLR